MRRALTTAIVLSVLVLLPLPTTLASAQDPVHGPSLAQSDPDTDEPASQDGNDDTGKYGLIGLSGMLGLFGYRRYRNTQTARLSDRASGFDRHN